MPDVIFDFPISANARDVFDGVSTPAGLDRWWTLTSKGSSEVGREWELFFGAPYEWRAQVSRSIPGREFELVMGRAIATGPGRGLASSFRRAAPASLR